MTIKNITMDHLARYGEIYAAAFSGEPWNDPWKPEDAEIHVKELLDRGSKCRRIASLALATLMFRKTKLIIHLEQCYHNLQEASQFSLLRSACCIRAEISAEIPCSQHNNGQGP